MKGPKSFSVLDLSGWHVHNDWNLVCDDVKGGTEDDSARNKKSVLLGTVFEMKGNIL